MENEEKNNKVNEPKQAYHSKANEFKIFNSFQEAEDDNDKWLASLTPEQHLENAVALIKRLYKTQLQTNTNLGTDLTID